MLETEVHRRSQVTELGAAIEPASLEVIRENGFLSQHVGDRIGELNFPAGTGADAFQLRKHTPA